MHTLQYLHIRFQTNCKYKLQQRVTENIYSTQLEADCVFKRNYMKTRNSFLLNG